jgi:ankyrin repeat protein
MGVFSGLFGKKQDDQNSNARSMHKIVQELISEKGLRPLGNKKRLTQTDDEYNVRLFLFADKNDSETYYKEFINYSEKNPPPFCIEIMHAKIHTIYEEPFGLVFPYEVTDTRPEYAAWFREATLACNEVLCNFQATDHNYEKLNQYIKEFFDWTILVPANFDPNSKKFKDIFSDPENGGYYFGFAPEKKSDKGEGKKTPSEADFSKFIQAVEKSNLDIVKKMLNSGLDPNTRMEDTSYPLILAAENGHTAIVTELLDSGANVNATNSKNMTALYYASSRGHTDVAKVLLEHKANPNIGLELGGGFSGLTSLMEAAYQGYVDCVELLLQNGADVNATTKDGVSALMRAAEKNHSACITLLLEKGADVNAKDTCGITPLMWAASFGGDVKATQLLLDAGADQTARDQWGKTALQSADTDEVVSLLEKGRKLTK